LTIGLAAVSKGESLTVSKAGADFEAIQAAIDVAGDGDVILVKPGKYLENLTITRPLTILGEEGVLLEPADAARPAIAVEGAQGVTIQGLKVWRTALGIDVSRSSCTISNCSISASDTGIHIAAFVGDAVSILDTIVRGSGQGTGVLIVGVGSALLSQCEINALATGILVGGTGTTAVLSCGVEDCYEAVVLSGTTQAVLVGNSLRGSYASGVRLDRVPFAADEGMLCLIDNAIEDSAGWGFTLCGLDGTGVDAAFGRIVGSDNRFSGNERGDVCPEDLPLPAGFLLP